MDQLESLREPNIAQPNFKLKKKKRKKKEEEKKKIMPLLFILMGF